MLFGLRSGEAFHVHRESPGRGEALHPGMEKLRFLEARGEACDEGFAQRAQRFGRQLLGADLDEEVAPHECHDEAAAAPAAAAAAAAAGFSAELRLRSGKPSASRLAR